MTHSPPVRPVAMTRRLSTAGPVVTLRRSTTFLSFTTSTYVALLVVPDRDLGNQQRGALLERHAHPGVEARQDLPVRVGQDAPHQQGAGGGRQVDGGEVEVALVGIAVLTGQPRRGPATSARPWGRGSRA